MTFEAEWARCSEWISDALPYADGVYTMDDVKDRIFSGDATFWPGERSALITTIYDYPQARWLMLWLAGGDLGELRAILRPVAEAWGRRHGCSRSIILGRAGWARALRDDGYEQIAVMVGKDLSQ